LLQILSVSAFMKTKRSWAFQGIGYNFLTLDPDNQVNLFRN